MRLIFCIYRNKKFRVKCAENYALKMIILFHGFLLNIVWSVTRDRHDERFPDFHAAFVNEITAGC